MQANETTSKNKVDKNFRGIITVKNFAKHMFFSVFSAGLLKRLILVFTAVSVSALYLFYLASCSYMGIGGSGKGFSQGAASEVNGFIINRGDIITEIGEYSGGSFRKLSENRVQIDFKTGIDLIDLNNITIDLTYYEDKQNKIYISGSYAQVNAKNYITERDFPKKEGYIPLYSIAYDRNTIALAAMLNGAVTTILVDLDKNTAEYLNPYTNLYYEDPDIYNQTFIQCLPVEITDGGKTLVCMETELINNEYYYSSTAYDNAFSNIGSGNNNINRTVISQIKTADAANYYCGIVNKNAGSTDGLEIIAVSGKPETNDLSGTSDLINIGVYRKSGAVNPAEYYLVNAKAIEANIYCSNFLDFDKTEDYLEFHEISINSQNSKKYDLGFKTDNSFKKALSRNGKYFILNPSRTKAAILYKNVIYIMDLTSNSANPNSAGKINTSEYNSSWDADDAILFIDDNTIIFNSGTTDNDGRMETIPKLIDVSGIFAE